MLPELLELLHLTRSRYSTVEARVHMTQTLRDTWGRPSLGRAEEEVIEVRLESPDDADAVLRGHVQSLEAHWQQCAFDPNVVIPELWLEPLEEVTVAGRRGIRVRGHRRPTSHDYFVLPMGADEYELVIDAERGIILRMAAVVDGHEALVFEILEIAFDRPV